MSLSADLEKLQRQKREEIRTLHQTYLRTKCPSFATPRRHASFAATWAFPSPSLPFWECC